MQQCIYRSEAIPSVKALKSIQILMDTDTVYLIITVYQSLEFISGSFSWNIRYILMQSTRCKNSAENMHLVWHTYVAYTHLCGV